MNKRFDPIACFRILLVVCLANLAVTLWAQGPASFLTGKSNDSDAYFMRVDELVIGGEFDASGSEEIVVDIRIDGQSRRLLVCNLDLPSDRLSTFQFKDSEYCELQPKPIQTLEIDVREEDVSKFEWITGTHEAIQLSIDDFGESSDRFVVINLNDIRLVEKHFFKADKVVELQGAQLVLALVRTARRDHADGQSASTVSDTFSMIERDVSLQTPSYVATFVERLAAAAQRASAQAGRSTHTYLRQRLFELSEQASSIQKTAGKVAEADPSKLDWHMSELRVALYRVREERHDNDSLRKLLKEIERALNRWSVTTTESNIAELEGRLSVHYDRLRKIINATKTIESSNEHNDQLDAGLKRLAEKLDLLIDQAERARHGWLALPELQQSWSQFRADLNRELGFVE